MEASISGSRTFVPVPMEASERVLDRISADRACGVETNKVPIDSI